MTTIGVEVVRNCARNVPVLIRLLSPPRTLDRPAVATPLDRSGFLGEGRGGAK